MPLSKQDLNSIELAVMQAMEKHIEKAHAPVDQRLKKLEGWSTFFHGAAWLLGLILGGLKLLR
jgi:hypothetical protein